MHPAQVPLWHVSHTGQSQSDWQGMEQKPFDRPELLLEKPRMGMHRSVLGQSELP